MKVVGLGQCSLDYIVTVDGFPEDDAKRSAIALKIEGGGPAGTALVALSRLGVETEFLGVIGDDREGGEIKKGVKKEDVSFKGLVTRKNGSPPTPRLKEK